jgi:hypothetical protein
VCLSTLLRRTDMYLNQHHRSFMTCFSINRRFYTPLVFLFKVFWEQLKGHNWTCIYTTLITKIDELFTPEGNVTTLVVYTPPCSPFID